MNNNEVVEQNQSIEWHQLHSEREEVCDALLLNVRQLKLKDSEADRRLVKRLRLIDDAMDRLMNGSYGECVQCGRWIEDTKLHADPAFPFCHACERVHEVCPPLAVLYSGQQSVLAH